MSASRENQEGNPWEGKRRQKNQELLEQMKAFIPSERVAQKLSIDHHVPSKGPQLALSCRVIIADSITA